MVVERQLRVGARRLGRRRGAVTAGAAVEAGLEVAGVFTFPGHGYGHDPPARERAARTERLPVLREPSGEGGRGLLLVAAIALRWGVGPGPGGAYKVVWAEVRVWNR